MHYATEYQCYLPNSSRWADITIQEDIKSTDIWPSKLLEKGPKLVHFLRIIFPMAKVLPFLLFLTLMLWVAYVVNSYSVGINSVSLNCQQEDYIGPVMVMSSQLSLGESDFIAEQLNNNENLTECLAIIFIPFFSSWQTQTMCMIMLCKNWQEYSLVEPQTNVNAHHFGSTGDDCTGITLSTPKKEHAKKENVFISHAFYRKSVKCMCQINCMVKTFVETGRFMVHTILYNELCL